MLHIAGRMFNEHCSFYRFDGKVHETLRSRSFRLKLLVATEKDFVWFSIFFKVYDSESQQYLDLFVNLKVRVEIETKIVVIITELLNYHEQFLINF